MSPKDGSCIGSVGRLLEKLGLTVTFVVLKVEQMTVNRPVEYT